MTDEKFHILYWYNACWVATTTILRLSERCVMYYSFSSFVKVLCLYEPVVLVVNIGRIG